MIAKVISSSSSNRVVIIQSSSKQRHYSSYLFLNTSKGFSSSIICNFCGIQQQQQKHISISSSSKSVISSTTTSNTTTNVSVKGMFSSSSKSYDTGPLHDLYHNLVHNDELEHDPIQLNALQALEKLYDQLLHNKPKTTTKKEEKDSNNNNTLLTGWIGQPSWMMSSSSNNTSNNNNNNNIKGAYLHGGVGCGKTFLMNEIFYNSITEQHPWYYEKQKTHFYKFMLNFHQELHNIRYNKDNNNSNNKKKLQGDELIAAVVNNIVQKGKLICFDEFQVTDVADALILQRLFHYLWYDHGCVIVATSNRPPNDLYLNGLQRDRFIPFIKELQKQCTVISMWDSDKDYRLVLKELDEQAAATNAIIYGNNEDNNNNVTPSQTQTTNNDKKSTTTITNKIIIKKVFFHGNKEEKKEFNDLFYKLVGNVAIAPISLQTQGRKVKIPQASLSKGIAKFTFNELCTKALGASDYILIGTNFHTIFIENIPKLTLQQLNYVRRFITFIDTMYECNCKLILHTVSKDIQYYQDIFQPETHTMDDEIFAFARTVSRLQEMSSQTYLKKQQKHTIPRSNKAELLSHKKAVVDVIPSLGDTKYRK